MWSFTAVLYLLFVVRFFARRAKKRTTEGGGQLSTVFAHYDRQDVARALRATMELFRWLAVETAQRWQYTYPASGDQAVTESVDKSEGHMNTSPSVQLKTRGEQRHPEQAQTVLPLGSFTNYYLGTIFRPRRTFDVLLADDRRLRFGLLARSTRWR